MTVIVFLGPTLSAAEARRVLPDADVRPPVSAGDVLKALQGSPSVIGLIDGLYEQVPAVWHKELLFAMSRGVWVYGASSMGALRAAELHPLGMVGVGSIFQAYASGALDSDDEVAVNHATAEFGYRPLSEAMVNIRFALRRAESLGYIGPETCASLTSLAKRRFYAERSWAALFADVRAAGLPEAELQGLAAWVRTARPNQKAEDATLLLERIAHDRERGLRPFVAEFAFEPTSHWERMVKTAEASSPRPPRSSRPPGTGP